MPYTIGISSGWWSIARDPNLHGLAQKVGGFGATGGVTFNQVDMESPAEFFEPRLKQNVLRMQRELGLRVGMHAEIGFLAAMESAERRIWEQSHVRLVESVKNAAELNIEYLNFHLSSTIQLQFEEAQKRPFGYSYQVVGPDGKALHELCDGSPEAKKKAITYIDPRWSLEEGLIREYTQKINREVDENIRQDIHIYENSPEFLNSLELIRRNLIAEGVRGSVLEYELNRARQALTRDKERQIKETRIAEGNRKLRDIPDEMAYDMWKRSVMGKYFIDQGEIGAYMITATHMKATGDPLWKNIANNRNPDDAYNDLVPEWNAAIAARYIEGHLNRKDHAWNKNFLNGMSVREFAEAKKVILTFEIPEVGGGGEGGHEALYRFYMPQHAYHFAKKIGSPAVKLTLDFEHMLAHKLDPYKILPKLPGDFGKYLSLLHLGEPKPYKGTAHIPLAIGTQAQEILYEWIYILRKKGFTDGIMIFERGGGRTGKEMLPGPVLENSVWVLRQIAKYLDQDTKPDELPPEFYGFAEQSKEFWTRQLVSVHQHAWDPLFGTIAVPDEKHTFLSRAAVEKGKAKEWEKGEVR